MQHKCWECFCWTHPVHTSAVCKGTLSASVTAWVITILPISAKSCSSHERKKPTQPPQFILNEMPLEQVQPFSIWVGIMITLDLFWTAHYLFQIEGAHWPMQFYSHYHVNNCSLLELNIYIYHCKNKIVNLTSLVCYFIVDALLNTLS